MKKSTIISILFFALFTLLNAQSKVIEKQLNEIFSLCEQKDYGKAADYFLFEVERGGKIDTVNLNYKNSKETREIKRRCKKIKALTDLSDSYKIIKTNVSKSSAEANVVFISHGRKLATKFIFLISGKKYKLFEIK